MVDYAYMSTSLPGMGSTVSLDGATLLGTGPLTSPPANPLLRSTHSPAQTIATRRVCSGDDDLGLFFCHFCQAAVSDIGQTCPGCAFPHAGDGKYINFGTATDQSCPADLGHLVKGLVATTPPASVPKATQVGSNSGQHYTAHGNTAGGGGRGISYGSGIGGFHDNPTSGESGGPDSSQSEKEYSISSGAEFSGKRPPSAVHVSKRHAGHSHSDSVTATHQETLQTALPHMRMHPHGHTRTGTRAESGSTGSAGSDALRTHSSLSILNWTRVLPPPGFAGADSPATNNRPHQTHHPMLTAGHTDPARPLDSDGFVKPTASLDFPDDLVMAGRPLPQCPSTSFAMAAAITSRLLHQGLPTMSCDLRPAIVTPHSSIPTTSDTFQQPPARPAVTLSTSVGVTSSSRNFSEQARPDAYDGRRSTGTSLVGSAELLQRLGEAHRRYLASSCANSSAAANAQSDGSNVYVQHIPYTKTPIAAHAKESTAAWQAIDDHVTLDDIICNQSLTAGRKSSRNRSASTALRDSAMMFDMD